MDSVKEFFHPKLVYHMDMQKVLVTGGAGFLSEALKAKKSRQVRKVKT